MINYHPKITKHKNQNTNPSPCPPAGAAPEADGKSQSTNFNDANIKTISFCNLSRSRRLADAPAGVLIWMNIVIYLGFIWDL